MEPESTPLFLLILEKVVIPLITLLVGWFGGVFRTKQKKEADILENMKQLLEMQKQYIADQDTENRKTRDINKQLEEKLDGKRRSIRQANWCKYTNADGGCPVLNHEAKLDGDKCETCKYNAEYAEGKA